MGEAVGIDQEECNRLKVQRMLEVKVDRLEKRSGRSILWDGCKCAVERENGLQGLKMPCLDPPDIFEVFCVVHAWLTPL